MGDLLRTKKAIVILGCSFAAGKGAYDTELVEECRPRRREHWGDCDYHDHNFDLSTLNYYAEKYKLEIRDGELHAHNMETANSFGNRLCSEYLDSEYTPINLSKMGGGNFTQIDKLNWLPIPWEKLEDVKVIWSITDPVRTDIFNASIQQDSDKLNHIFPERANMGYNTVWPFDVPDVDDFSRNYNHKLRTWDADHALTNFFATNFLRLMSNLSNWCKAHDADLTMFDAFCPSYDVTTIANMFINPMSHSEILQNFIYNLPWDDKIKLDDQDTFFNFCMQYETNYDYLLDDKHNMWEFVELDEKQITCEWLMPCGHPSAKAHDKLAKLLKQRIFT